MRPRPEAGTRPPGRVLLVEALDAAGAALADARLHATALENAGFRIRTIVIDFMPEHRIRAGADARDPEDLLLACHREAVRAETARFAPDLTLLASGALEGGRAARWLSPDHPTLIWPTGIHGARARRRLFRRTFPPALALAGRDRDESRLTHDAAGLEWSIGEPPDRRARQSLWDGDYVVSPTPLSGRVGRAALAAFAGAAQDLSAVDLVVLGAHDRSTASLAEALGIETRVHFVGSAPYDAERAWIASAAAVLLAVDSPISAGLVLRSLAAGTPVVSLEEGHSSREAGAGLAQRHCAPRPEAGGGSAALARALAHGPEVVAEIAHGKAFAARHTLAATTELLAQALGAAPSRRRKAA